LLALNSSHACSGRGLAPVSTVANRSPATAPVRRGRALVDEITLVTDEAIAAAMELAARTLGIVLEPAGAAGLAATAERVRWHRRQ
jgi:threonine dehydratase